MVNGYLKLNLNKTAPFNLRLAILCKISVKKNINYNKIWAGVIYIKTLKFLTMLAAKYKWDI